MTSSESAASSWLAPDDVTAEALRGVITDERVVRFYEARQWEPVWTVERAEALVAALQDARRHGLESRGDFARSGVRAPARRQES